MFANFDIVSWLQQLLYWLPGILVGFVMHEFSHAYVANALGDPTPKLTGRLTLNPVAHIDPIGFLMLIIVHFGWAKPVMTNPALYKKHRKHGFALVSVAGVTMNLLLAFLFLFVLVVLIINQVVSLDNPIIQILNYAVQINFTLMAFNLIPIPPLDGYNILKDLVLVKHVRSQTLWNFERYGTYILLALLVLGGTSLVIGAVSNFFLDIGLKLFGWIFHVQF